MALLEALVGEHVDLVYSAALRQVRDPHLADDVTQAVFMVMVRKAERLPREELLGPWLVKVTRYVALTALRIVGGGGMRKRFLAVGRRQEVHRPTHR